MKFSCGIGRLPSRISTILLVLGGIVGLSSAFTGPPSLSASHHHHSLPRTMPTATPSSSATITGTREQRGRGGSLVLFMSDVPQDDESEKKNKKRRRRNNNNNAHLPQNNHRNHNNHDVVDRWYKVPPPPPEDWFVMIGDLLSLAVYGITDHLVCQVASRLAVRRGAQIVSDVVASQAAAVHAPVWWEADSPQAAAVLQATVESHFVTQYGPLLEPMGQATTLLAGSWLLAGWFNRAFLFQNTLDCPTDKALTVTARTWFTTCVLLFGMVVLSQACMGVEDWATTFHRGDVDMIVDQLTVLVVWRFMASSLLGSGGGGGGGGSKRTMKIGWPICVCRFDVRFVCLFVGVLGERTQ